MKNGDFWFAFFMYFVFVLFCTLAWKEGITAGINAAQRSCVSCQGLFVDAMPGQEPYYVVNWTFDNSTEYLKGSVFVANASLGVE